jgi:uncharacterized protein
MPVDAQLVELLVCPACHGEIEYKDRRNLIICTRCGLHYPVRDNIPVMLISEATRPSQRRGTGEGDPDSPERG